MNRNDGRESRRRSRAPDINGARPGPSSKHRGISATEPGTVVPQMGLSTHKPGSRRATPSAADAMDPSPMSSLKKTLMKQGMKLMSDPRVMKLMQDERVMKAVMQMMAV